MRKVAVETVDAVRRRLAVEVPETEVAAEIERAYADLGRKAKVRGFRPGRAPRAVLERLFGDRVRADVFTKLINDSCRAALASQHIEPVSQPEIVTETAEPGSPLRYSITVEVKPEVVAQGYQGLSVQRPLRAVTEVDVDRYLDALRESLAQLVPITERSVAQAGDMATIDYEARAEQRLVGRAENRMVEVDPGASPEAPGAHVEGLEIGDSRTYEVDYPADHGNPDIAGKRVAITVRLKALALKVIPALDDEFAKDQGDCATLAELRERVRRHLAAAAEEDAESAVRAALLDALVRAHDIEVPQAMVERRADSLVEDLIASLGPRRPPASREAEFRARIRQELMGRARDHVKASLVLEAVARQENLTVDEDEIDRHIEALAKRAGGSGERLRALYRSPEARVALRAELLRERALERIVERARIETVPAQSSVAEDGRTG